MQLVRVVFGGLVVLSLLCGFLAHYARDVRRDRAATRRFAGLGAAAAALTIAIGWWGL